MISFLSGTILAVDGITLTVQVDGTGIGYDVLVSSVVLADAREGTTVRLVVHHHISEVNQVLFGFHSREERTLFRELIKVSGVGGKTALSILGLGQDVLLRAIQLGDDKILASVPGIGKKTAQKIIVDLSGSIDMTVFSKGSVTHQKNISDMTLISSLVSMGYEKSNVETIVSELDPSESLEIRTVQAIRALSK